MFDLSKNLLIHKIFGIQMEQRDRKSRSLSEMLEAAKAYRRPDETFLANVIEGIGKADVSMVTTGKLCLVECFVMFFRFLVYVHICNCVVTACNYSIHWL